MDPLDDILDTLRLTGGISHRTQFSGPWAVAVPQLANAARFHLVVQGRCHVAVEGSGDALLGPGDLLLVTRGQPHVLADAPGRAPQALDDLPRQDGHPGVPVLSIGEGDAAAATLMVSGHLGFRRFATHPLLDALPDRIVVTAGMRMRSPWLDDLLRMLARRVFEGGLGAVATGRRLAEAAFAEVLRAGLADSSAISSALEAFRDPQIGRALELIHGDVAQDWTVGGLARASGMSRSVFAERFKALMGTGPIHYLTEWRLQRALSMLEDPRLGIQEISVACGYQSAASFTRAFSTRFGGTPRDLRRGREDD